jgi:hypothetical protein
MLRQAAVVLLAASILAPAATADGYSAAPTATTQTPARHVVVRTELVPASSEGFHWLDAAAGFGLAIGLAAVVLLVVGDHRTRPAKSAS